MTFHPTLSISYDGHLIIKKGVGDAGAYGRKERERKKNNKQK